MKIQAWISSYLFFDICVFSNTGCSSCIVMSVAFKTACGLLLSNILALCRRRSTMSYAAMVFYNIQP